MRVRLVKFSTAIAVAAVLFPCARWINAQEGDGIDPRDLVDVAQEEHGGDVYINDSFEAADALVQIAKLSAAGNWTDAARLIDSTVETEGDKLLRKSSGGFGSVRDEINRLISRWPAEGLRAYREHVGADCDAAFDSAERRRDVRALVLLWDRYFCTSRAAQATDGIGQLAIESGDFLLARYVYSRILVEHPDRSQFAQVYGARLRIVSALLGQPAAADLREDAKQTVRWFGQDRTADEVVRQIREQFSVTRPDSGDDWPVFAGSYDRSREPDCEVDEPGLLWRHRMHSPKADRDSGVRIEFPGRSSRETSRDLTTFPVAAGDFVIVQRYREVIALRRNTGTVVWRFTPDPVASEPDNYLDDRPPGWDSPTVHRGRVYASLPREEVSYYDYSPTRGEAQIICLDLETGRVLWRHSQSLSGEFAAELKFDSSPIVTSGQVLVVGRRRRSFGFEDCYLYRFRAADGVLEGRVHLGSASTATFGSRTATSAIAALHEDTIYVGSGLGTIAGISAYSGSVKWLTLYPRIRVEDGGAGGRTSRDVRPWQFNPLVYADGKLYALPTDATSLLVVDPENGAIIQSVPVNELAGMGTLLGVRNGVACGVGDEVICYDVAARSTRWRRPIEPGSRLFGRGAWVGEELLIPLRDRLVRYDVGSGSTRKFPWDVESQGGNLLPLPDALIVAGTDEVTAYVRKSDIWTTLRDKMAAAPQDPLPAIELAEVALGAGEHVEALAVLEEAVSRFSRLPTADPVNGRRLFSDVCKFALVLSEIESLTPTDLERLLTYASQLAPDAESSLEYRLKLAPLFETLDAPARAVVLYHQILRDRSLRDLPVDGSETDEKAATVAASRIGQLIERHGRSIYEPLEAEASRWLESARTSNHEGLYVRLIETFPNSEAAPRAMVDYGRWLLANERYDDAVQRLTLAYHAYGSEVDVQSLFCDIADAHEGGGSPERAYLWLDKAAREFPGYRLTRKGKSYTFAEYRDRFAALRDRVIPSYPDVHLPLALHRTINLPDGARLLAPRWEDQPGASWTKLYVNTADGLMAFDSDTGEPIWNQPVVVPSGPQLLFAGEKLALIATHHQVLAISTADGSIVWTLGKQPPHVEDPAGDWENGGAIRSIARDGDRLVVAFDTGRITGVSIETGNVEWTRAIDNRPASTLYLTNPFLVYDSRQDERIRLTVLDALTGRTLGSTLTQETRPLEELLVTIDGLIVVVTSQTISIYDASTLKRRWRITSNGLIRKGSLRLDLDSLFFSDNGRSIRKLRLGDGVDAWESDELLRFEDEMAVLEAGTSLIVTSATEVAAIDRSTGLTLWRGVSPDHPNFVRRMITRRFVLAIDAEGGEGEEPNRAYFYDHRNASGLIPQGGAVDLGPDRIGEALTTSAGVAVQSGAQLRLFTSD